MPDLLEVVQLQPRIDRDGLGAGRGGDFMFVGDTFQPVAKSGMIHRPDDAADLFAPPGENAANERIGFR